MTVSIYRNGHRIPLGVGKRLPDQILTCVSF